jgi:hypothetical protein
MSSGAFPRYARNTGTGESHADAVTLKAADQRLYHDQAHPSAVICLSGKCREKHRGTDYFPSLIGKTDHSACHPFQLRAQRLVVDVSDERMHDGDADRARQHRRV